jgi:U4/U6.U5 tri-snRNP-associated protein 2
MSDELKRTREDVKEETKRVKITQNEDSYAFYLGQIQRTNLDFDFEKLCSVTLSPSSVYCCLVCGKFFKGKATGTPLNSHSLEVGHFVVMNLATGNVYAIPEGNLIDDSSLSDIKYNLHPSFTEKEIEAFGIRITSSTEQKPAIWDLHNNKYFPGLIGLNDLHGTDFVNSVLQAVVRVKRLRDYFLLRSEWENTDSRVTRAFGELVCQMFNTRRFKSSASPHELLQAISSASGKKFEVGRRTDASQFLAWLLFELHKGSGGTKNPMSSFIHECFQGEVRVETTVIELKREFGEEDEKLAGSTSGPQYERGRNQTAAGERDHSFEELGTFTRAQVVTNTVERVPFLFLSLDLPTNPLFKDSIEGQTVIPRTTLLQVLEKYDGATTVDVTLPGGRLEQKRYRVTKLPNYLVIHLKRFTKNQFSVCEKNRALVSLPVANLDMSPYMESSALTTTGDTRFNLIANVCHDGGVGPEVKDAIADGSYRANVYYPPRDAWFETHDLVVRETMPQLVTISETFLAVYERVKE